MKAKQISTLEKQIMEIIWKKRNCSVREVYNEILKTKQIAYTTVLTIFQRLYEKRFITRKQTTKAYLYSPRISKEAYTKHTLQSFLKSYIHSFGDIALVSFAESIESLPKEKKAYLMEILKKHGKNK